VSFLQPTRLSPSLLQVLHKTEREKKEKRENKKILTPLLKEVLSFPTHICFLVSHNTDPPFSYLARKCISGSSING
jgi:hypothetical protein